MQAKRILAIFIVIPLVLAAIPPIATAATSQTWYLSNVDAGGTSDADLIMYKNDTSQCTATETVRNGMKKDWTADEAATVGVGFQAGDWDSSILLATAFADGEQFTIHIGYWDGDNFISFGSVTKTGSTGQTSFPFIISASAFTVTAGDWLALQIDNPSEGTDNLQLEIADGCCYIMSPNVDPGYPIPELPTIILLAIGLVGLAIFIWLFGFSFRGASSSKVGNS